jgi:hypothetical protein
VAGTLDCNAGALKNAYVGVLGVKRGKTIVNAFPAAAGFNMATGLGSVNATNLLYNY